GGCTSAGSSEKYGVVFDSVSNSARALATSSGVVSKSMIEAAKTFAPITCPLCEIELTGVTAAFHSWYWMPGTEAGKFNRPAGTTQDTSPLSLEEADWTRPPSGVVAVRKLICGFSANF